MRHPSKKRAFYALFRESAFYDSAVMFFEFLVGVKRVNTLVSDDGERHRLCAFGEFFAPASGQISDPPAAGAQV
jgi:hypothetical protein